MGDKQILSEQTPAIPSSPVAPTRNDNVKMFVTHLEHASRVVHTWPTWKQGLLGSNQTQSRPTHNTHSAKSNG